jgi:DnaK suppressor protein
MAKASVKKAAKKPAAKPSKKPAPKLVKKAAPAKKAAKPTSKKPAPKPAAKKTTAKPAPKLIQKSTAKVPMKPIVKASAKPASKAAPVKAVPPKPVLVAKPKKPYKPARLPQGYKPHEKGEEYMNPLQQEYFRQKLLSWRKELMSESRETLDHLHEENWHQADIADRASLETEAGVELRTRNRYLKLVARSTPPSAVSKTANTAIARKPASRLA